MGEGRSLGFGPGDFNRLQVHPGCRVLVAHPNSVSNVKGQRSDGKAIVWGVSEGGLGWRVTSATWVTITLIDPLKFNSGFRDGMILPVQTLIDSFTNLTIERLKSVEGWQLSTRQIHVFISHAWAHSHHYDTLESWIFGEPWSYGQASLDFRNFSVPKYDPIHNAPNSAALQEAIFNQIARSHVVVIPTGMYAIHSRWIQKEILASKYHEKPILAVYPYPRRFSDNGLKMHLNEERHMRNTLTIHKRCLREITSVLFTRKPTREIAMNDSDFPALYRTADAAAVRAQTTFLRIFKASAILLLLGAMVSLINAKHAIGMIISVLLFLGSLGFFIYGKSENFRGTWYQSRALAESVKTSTWRLIMGADPFVGPLNVDFEKFRLLLNELLHENRGLAKHLSGQWSNEDQITPEMKRLIQLPFEEKKQYYLAQRIDHQSIWYSKKAQKCIDDNNKYFIRLCIVYGLAILFLLIRVMMPALDYIPVQLCAVIATSIISWMQLKKFDELASSYGLTAHEIGIIKSRIGEIGDQQKLAEFVADSENAFSREHTQWAARRDH